MSLNVDPKITVEQIRKGQLTGDKAKREINNLEAEITSGVYTLEQMGLSSMDELLEMKSKATH